MSVTDTDLEKFKRRLIKVIARMSNEGLSEEDMWKKLKEQTKSNYKALWVRMRNLVLKKLRLLFSVGDVVAKVPAVARMTFTDWLMFDLVLVNETIDMISLATPNQDESMEVSLPQPPHLWYLFHSVKRHCIEEAKGPEFVKAWINLTIEYNAPSSGRQCSPMLLQLRWYLLKEKTRNGFYEFWSKFNKLANNKEDLNKLAPNELYSAIAKTYPEIVTAPFKSWNKLIKIGRIVNPLQFQKKGKRGVVTNEETSLANNGSEDTPTTGDVEVIEPQIVTITLDDDSDDLGDHVEVTAKKSSTSQNKDVAPSTSKEKDAVPITSNIDTEFNKPTTSKHVEVILPSTSKSKNDITQSTSKYVEVSTPTTSKDKELITLLSAKNEAVITPSTSKDIQSLIKKDKQGITSSTSIVKEVIRPSTSKHKYLTIKDKEEVTSIDITDDFVITTDFDNTVDYKDTKNPNATIDCSDTSKDEQTSKKDSSSSNTKAKEVIRPLTITAKYTSVSNTNMQAKKGTSIDKTEDFVITTDFDDNVDYSGTKDPNEIIECSDASDTEVDIAQQKDDITVNANALNAFCGEQYIVNSFEDNDIDQELIDSIPVVVPEVDGLSSVKIIRTSHVEEFTPIQVTKTQRLNKNPNSNGKSDQVSKSVNKTSDVENIVSNILEQEISRYSVIKIEEPDIREELKRQGKEDLLKIIPDTSQDIVFDIIDDGIACDDDDDGVDDNNDSDDESDLDENSFKIDHKLLLYPIVCTVKLEDMNALRKRKNFNRVTTEKLIENIFKESKVKKATNVEELKEKEIKEDSNHKEMLPEVETNIGDDLEEYDDPITVLPMQETFIKTEQYNSEMIRILQEPIRFTTNIIEEPTEPPIKRIKISHHLFNKPKLRTYSPIQLCKNPDFNTRLKKINTGILVYQQNRNKLLHCKPLTIDLDKGFERKLVDNTVYLSTEEKRAENTSALSELLLKEKQSDAEESLLKLILEKDASVYVRKQTFEEQELLAARKSKTINLPDIDQVRKLNQRLLTAEVTPISFGVKQNDFVNETLENVITAPKESPPFSPEEAPMSDREDLPVVESKENLSITHPDKTPMTVIPAEISGDPVSEEPTKTTKLNKNVVIENEHTITEIKQEKQEPEKPNRFKSVENELTLIELATKDTLPDIELIESENSATKQIRRRLSQQKPARSNQRYTPAWCRPIPHEPTPGLVTNDTLLKMLKYIHGEEEDCVIVPQAIQDSEIIRKNKKNASKRLKKQAENLLKTISFYNHDETPSENAENEKQLCDPKTNRAIISKATKPKSKMFISNDPNVNVHPKLSSFCCWIKEIEYRINLPAFNLDSVPHPCLYFDFGICTCCCREGNNKHQDQKATEQQNFVNPPALKITIKPSNRNVPKLSRRKSALPMNNSKESIAIQRNFPTNTESQVKSATVETSQAVKQPTLFLEPASIGLNSSCESEVIGILSPDELAYLQGRRKHPPIKVLTGENQQKRIILSKRKIPNVRNRIPAQLQTDAKEDCIVLSDDDDERDKRSNQPRLVIDGLNNAPLTVTSASSYIPVEKRGDTYFKKTIRTKNKHKELPLNLGLNKVLLTTVEVPGYLNNVCINSTRNNDTDIPVQPYNSTITAPLINLPKGVGIVLMPDNTLSLSIEPGVTVPESELAHMPTLLSLVQKQLGQHLGVTPTIINTISTENKEISLLSDDENSVDKTTETENIIQQVSKLNEVEKSLETDKNDLLPEKDVSLSKEASNIDTDASPGDSNNTANNILLHCSEQLCENMSDTQNPNAETTLEKEITPTSINLNTSKSVTDSDLQEKEDTQTLKNIHEDNIEELNKETTASRNETLTQEVNPEKQETLPTKSFLKVKDFAAVNNLDVDAPLDADSGHIKKTILSDLMEMSGISSEDTVPVMPATLDDVVSYVPETPVDLPPLLPITPGNMIPLVAPATPDIARLELNPVFTIKGLRYAYSHNGKFYVLNLETGSIVPLKVSINKTKKVIVPANETPTPKLPVLIKRKEKIETRINLVDSDAPMEEDYLVDSDDSNDTPTQTEPITNMKVLKAINHQKTLLLKHTGGSIQPKISSFVYSMEPDSADPRKMKTKLLPRILCKRPLRKIKTKTYGGLLMKELLKQKPEASNSLPQNNMPNTASVSVETLSDKFCEDVTEDAPAMFEEKIHNHVDLEEDEAAETPADKDYSSSDDEPLSILKDRKEKVKRTYTKRPLVVDGEDGSAKRVRTNDNEAFIDTKESSNTAEQTDTCGVPEKVASTEETQTEGEEVSNERNAEIEMEVEELEIFENYEELEANLSPSGEGAASEVDDEDFILGA